MNDDYAELLLSVNEAYATPSMGVEPGEAASSTKEEVKMVSQDKGTSAEEVKKDKDTKALVKNLTDMGFPLPLATQAVAKAKNL